MSFYGSWISKKYIRVIINILVFLVCACLLYIKIDFLKVVSQTRQVPLYIFFITVSISIIRTWLSGIRWSILHPDKNTRLSQWSYFRLSMIAHICNKFMPGALGGDIVKTIYAVKENKTRKSKNVIAVLVDRTVGLISIMIFGLIALLPAGQDLDINVSNLIFLFFVLCCFIIILMSRSVLDLIEKLFAKIGVFYKFFMKVIKIWRESVDYYRSNTRSVVFSFVLCVPIHFASFISFYLLSQSLDMQIEFLEMVFAVALMWLITSLPISVGGLGVRELSLIWLLGLFGVPSEQAVSLSVLSYINTVIVAIIALPLLVDFRKR